MYWKYIPEIFNLQNDEDHNPCAVYKNYQLVRNVLAASIRPDGKLYPERGHAVLIYDERNPEFQEGGKRFKAFKDTQAALKDPMLLRKCSWQRILHRRVKC